MSDVPHILDLPPGSVVVVGPCGRLVIDIEAGRVRVASGLDFILPSVMSPAHRALVEERWAGRSEYGYIPQGTARLDCAPALARALTRPSREVTPAELEAHTAQAHPRRHGFQSLLRAIRRRFHG